jgi:hypothetical protein
MFILEGTVPMPIRVEIKAQTLDEALKRARHGEGKVVEEMKPNYQSFTWNHSLDDVLVQEGKAEEVPFPEWALAHPDEA